jgi:hypothetical protein
MRIKVPMMHLRNALGVLSLEKRNGLAVSQ